MEKVWLMPPDSIKDFGVEARIAQQLTQRLREQVNAADGFLPFVDVMQALLYAPGLGYYVNGRQRFGAAGDFVTAPEQGDLFGATLARAARAALQAGALPARLFEVGAGSGRLAASLLAEAGRIGWAVERYEILEVSPDLRAAQRQTLVARLGAAAVDRRVRWVDDLPEAGYSGLMLANEVLDAFPVEWFVWHGATQPPGQVGLVLRDGTLTWAERDAPELLANVIRGLEARYGPWPEGYRSEWCPAVAGWLDRVAAGCDRVAVMLVDYGYPGAARYAPERVMGTLAGVSRHQRVVDPLQTPGAADWTAHVDFTQVAEAAVAAGFRVEGYAPQGAFLLAAGLADVFERDAAPNGDGHALTARAREVRALTLPGEMGETFQVMLLSRGCAAPLWPASWPDIRGRLQARQVSVR